MVSLKVCDTAAACAPPIDSAQMVIRIEQGKGRKDRYVMLPPALLDMLRQWWEAARPQGWLFPGRPPVKLRDDSLLEERYSAIVWRGTAS